MIANLLTWLALIAQTVSACGTGLALCINRQGEVRVEVAGTPCDACSHDACSHEQHDDDDCCSGEESTSSLPAGPADAWKDACGCLHLELADPALAAIVGQVANLPGELPANMDAPPAMLTAADLMIAAGFHDPPEPHPFISQLAMLRSVMLRC